MRWPWFTFLVACGTPSATLDAPARDHEDEPTVPSDGPSDAPDAAAPPRDGAVASREGPLADWARYTIAPGAHSATLVSGGSGDPLGGFVSGVSGRDYLFSFDPSAVYTIAQPAQPNDQLDWNKLPGISDCGTLDLAADGAMFGWRWRLDTSPNVLEVTAYANNAGTHLTPMAPMILLDTDDLASLTPLRYRLSIDGALYRFSVSGTIRGRVLDVTATLARRCASKAASSLSLQWAAGFYFGGTSTSPSTITARIFEQPFL